MFTSLALKLRSEFTDTRRDNARDTEQSADETGAGGTSAREHARAVRTGPRNLVRERMSPDLEAWTSSRSTIWLHEVFNHVGRPFTGPAHDQHASLDVSRSRINHIINGRRI